MFLFAFNTFARVGQITLTTGGCLKNIISIEDIQTIDLGDMRYKVSDTFRNFKHRKGKPHVLFLCCIILFSILKVIYVTINANNRENNLMPVSLKEC